MSILAETVMCAALWCMAAGVWVIALNARPVDYGRREREETARRVMRRP